MAEDWFSRAHEAPARPDVETVTAARLPLAVLGALGALAMPLAVAGATGAGAAWLSSLGRWRLVTGLVGPAGVHGPGIGAVEFAAAMLGRSALELVAAAAVLACFLAVGAALVMLASPPRMAIGEHDIEFRFPFRQPTRIRWSEVECFVVTRVARTSPTTGCEVLQPEAVYWVGRSAGTPLRATALPIPGRWPLSPQDLKAKLTRHLWQRFPDLASNRNVYRHASAPEGTEETVSAHR